MTHIPGLLPTTMWSFWTEAYGRHPAGWECRVHCVGCWRNYGWIFHDPGLSEDGARELALHGMRNKGWLMLPDFVCSTCRAEE